MKYAFFNTQQGGIQNSRRNGQLIRHGNGFMEKSTLKFFMFIAAENTGSVNMVWTTREYPKWDFSYLSETLLALKWLWYKVGGDCCLLLAESVEYIVN